ncbi:hypothetical protein EDC96DRAFT_532371 [Choanephora cucurbitarum]|nr:hypothetical protein EDC96DRAFT_532371 [Choanephora cucurbitarum]
MISIYSDMNFMNNNKNTSNNNHKNLFHQTLLDKPQQTGVDTYLPMSHYPTNHSIMSSTFPSPPPPPPPALVPSLIPSQHTQWNQYNTILSHSNYLPLQHHRPQVSGMPTFNDVLPITSNETFNKGHYCHQRLCSTPNLLYGQSMYPLSAEMSLPDESRLLYMKNQTGKQNARRTSVHTSRSSSPSEAGRSSSPVNKRYSCSVCHKRFTRPSSLTTHMYSHTGEKPFECTVEGCGRKFSVVSNLRRHAKIHNNSNISSSTAFTYSP